MACRGAMKGAFCIKYKVYYPRPDFKTDYPHQMPITLEIALRKCVKIKYGILLIEISPCPRCVLQKYFSSSQTRQKSWPGDWPLRSHSSAYREREEGRECPLAGLRRNLSHRVFNFRKCIYVCVDIFAWAREAK
jgi:hypothetical protein